MDNSVETMSIDCEMPQQQSLPIDNNSPLANDKTDSLKSEDQNSNSENQASVETTDSNSQNVTVASEISLVVAPTDNSMPPLPPLPKDDKALPQPPAPYSADYNMQNYANYNYNMYNYNNFYGYPYPQYQWDYNSQQYYQPYQNYYNYNYNTSQSGTSKPPLPHSDAVQLPVEEKPSNKTNATTVDDPNRYSPTAEPDDDDATKGSSENTKSDVFIIPPQTTMPLTNPVPFQNVSSEQIEIPQNSTESIENKIQQPVVPLITQVQQPIVPVIAEIQPYNIPPAQQSSYLINPQIKTQPTEAVNELKSQQQNSPTLNGKDDTVEKVSKVSTVLGKHQAKKRLMAFSMMKQKLQEQSNLINDNQGSDVGEGNDVEFIPELNVFQTATKKKVVTNKKVIKVIKAQQTIEQIEEMKKDELMQGNNAALYQHLLRSSGNEAPILQKLGIESLAEKYSAKIREQDKRLKRHHHKHRDERRGHKYRRRSHSKSRSRSRSKSAEKPKMRALEVRSWKDFVNGGFHFDKFRRFKLDEAEEIKEKERKSRSKKRHRDSRSDGKNQNTESIVQTETEKGSGEQNLRYNILDRKKEILKGLEVVTHEGDCTKDFPSYLIQYTKSKPVIKYSQNPAKATCHLQNRQQMLATLLPEIEAIVHKFFSSMKPKRLKENPVENNYNLVDDQLSVIMKDKNIYPFKGWWPKKFFIVTQVKEDPNVEIDSDALINEFTTSKRTKKSRFNDDTLVDLRPTVPSKWDSDYDGSPAADKAVDVEDSQNVEMNTNDVCAVSREENNLPHISHQEEAMHIGEEEPKIQFNVCQIVPTTFQEPQEHAKLDTEYEEFLKIVSAEKANEKNEMPITAVQKENENNLSVNLVPLNDESVQDEESENDDTATKSSDESVSLHNTAEESIDRLFVKSSSSIDKKFKKKKKNTKKKAKKFKKKENKKKKYKSSSSESSQDSESEDSDSSSEDESESTDDSSSSVEEKKKKKKIKDGKKKKSKANYKKKHKGDKNKIKKPENEKDSNSSILNLLEKAFNVEIKKRPESDESKKKKKKRKHEKKEKKSTEDNDDEFEKVKECLKETFTKLVKTDKAKKNQSLSCADTTVNEVLKYLKMDKEKFKKNKKSKKSSKRKCDDSDNSDDEKSIKRSRLDESFLKLDDNEKKKKKKKKSSGKGSVVDSEEHVLKKKCKKKSKTTDTSDTDDDVELKYTKSKKEKDSENFFGQRPNEWNVKNKSSMRGVVHHSVDKNINYTSKDNISVDDVKIEKSKCKELNSGGKISCSLDTEKNKNKKSMLLDILKEQHSGKNKNTERLNTRDENVQEIKGDVLKNVVEERIQINFKISGSECSEEEYNFLVDQMLNKSDRYDSNELKHKNDLVPQSASMKDNNNGQVVNKDINNVFKSILNKSLDQSDKSVVPTIITPIVPVQEPISYRDKVKMNLKKLSTCQHTPFIFGFSLPLNVSKLNSLKKENIKENFQVLAEKTKTPEEDESQLLKIDCRPKVVICPQTQYKKSDTSQVVVPPKIDMEANNDELDQCSNLDNSEKSYSDDSSVASANTLEYDDEEDNEQVNPNLLEDYLSSINEESQKYKNEILSENSNFKEQHKHAFDMTESNRSSDLENEENEVSLKFQSIFADEETTTTFSNCADTQSEQYFGRDSESTKMFSPERKDSDSICSQQSSIDLEVTNIELINQWIFDWSMLDKCVRETSNFVNYRIDNSNEFQMKKKSRWDKQFKNNVVKESQRVSDEPENYRNKMRNQTTDELKTASAQSDIDIFLERQSQQDEFASLSYGDDSTDYDYYTRNWCDEYNEYSQEYGQQYSYEPRYSEMKTIEYDQLSPVDYSIYENYNPDYDYNGENYESWKSIDTSSNQLVTDEMLLQVKNVLEILPSENIVTIVPDFQDEKSNSDCRIKQFFQLYQQYFQHYNQNPIKYSMSDPVFSNTTKIDISALDTLPPQENLDGNAENKTVLIPLQDRAYERIFEDGNNSLFITNDNYIAYCAIEDKCMVHIAVESINRDGIEDKVRHCFNINQNGGIIEYWLHADLIPFYDLSDSESEVFSDDEVCSEKSNSVGEDDHVGNNNDCVDDNIIEKDWVLVDSEGEDKDSWLKDPCILEKYGCLIDGIGQTVTECNQDCSNSSEYDTDASDSNVETSESKKQNVTVNPFQMSFVETEDDKNIVDVNAPIDDVKQTENISEKLDLNIETNDNVMSDQLVLNAETEHVSNALEVNEDLTSKITIEINENVSTEFEEKDNENVIESGLSLKDGISVDALTMMTTNIKQKVLIQRLQILGRKKSQEKLPDTALVCCNENMESVKHPFLGLFQPPTISILNKNRDTDTDKHVTFADGIGPADDLAVSSMRHDVVRLLSPPPLKTLIRETLNLKRNLYPFMKSKRILRTTKLTMTNKKVAMVNPLIKSTDSSSNIVYYIGKRCSEDSTKVKIVVKDNVVKSDDSSNSDNISSPGLIDLTPVPSDNDCWNDDENVKER